MKLILIYAVLFLLMIIVAYYVSSIISKEISKRRKTEEKRISELSATEKGKRILIEESEKRNARVKKLEPFCAAGLVFSNLLFLAVGTAGVYFCIKDLMAGAKLKDILFLNKGFYFVSPFLIIYAVLKFCNFIKNAGNKD